MKYEYKVVVSNMSPLVLKVDPQDLLQSILDGYSRAGWRLYQCTFTDLGNRCTMIFEREKPEESEQ